jgi:hypothetical protein
MIHKYFVEGREAFRDSGQRDFPCPYAEGSEPRRSWIAGWDHEWFEQFGDDDE